MDVNSSLLLLLKATFLLAIGFAAVRWERTAPAVRRHGVWSATFVALLALPLLALSLPGIRVGRRYLARHEDVDAYVARRSTTKERGSGAADTVDGLARELGLAGR